MRAPLSLQTYLATCHCEHTQPTTRASESRVPAPPSPCGAQCTARSPQVDAPKPRVVARDYSATERHPASCLGDPCCRDRTKPAEQLRCGGRRQRLLNRSQRLLEEAWILWPGQCMQRALAPLKRRMRTTDSRHSAQTEALPMGGHRRPASQCEVLVSAWGRFSKGSIKIISWPVPTATLFTKKHNFWCLFGTVRQGIALDAISLVSASPGDLPCLVLGPRVGSEARFRVQHGPPGDKSPLPFPGMVLRPGSRSGAPASSEGYLPRGARRPRE